jgi:hypothetical protein
MPTIRGQIKSNPLAATCPDGEEHSHESALSGKVIVAPKPRDRYQANSSAPADVNFT